MIENIVLLLFLWGLIIGAFIVGLFWNAHAYDRGYEDGLAARAATVDRLQKLLRR